MPYRYMLPFGDKSFGVILNAFNKNRTGDIVHNPLLKRWFLAVLLVLMPGVADAVGLGRLTVLSALGQPFNAEIELVSVQKDELFSLAARLASPDAYRQANMQYGAAASGLSFSIGKRPDGEPFIKITSARPINEPFINLLIELNWAAGRIMREYTALVDPPGYAPAPAVASAPTAAPEAQPAPAQQPPIAVATPALVRPAARSEYGPVKRGETLSKIAASVKPEGVTLEQMLVGIYRGNPAAFVNNMSRMKAGKSLRIPDKEQLTAVTQREAREEVRLQAADWNSYRRKVADTAGVASERKTAASKRESARVQDKTGSKDVLRLSSGKPPGGGQEHSTAERIRMLEEEVVAQERTLKEANERIKELEKAVKDSAAPSGRSR